jgi:hypothetical protein
MHRIGCPSNPHCDWFNEKQHSHIWRFRGACNFNHNDDTTTINLLSLCSLVGGYLRSYWIFDFYKDFQYWIECSEKSYHQYQHYFCDWTTVSSITDRSKVAWKVHAASRQRYCWIVVRVPVILYGDLSPFPVIAHDYFLPLLTVLLMTKWLIITPHLPQRIIQNTKNGSDDYTLPICFILWN